MEWLTDPQVWMALVTLTALESILHSPLSSRYSTLESGRASRSNYINRTWKSLSTIKL